MSTPELKHAVDAFHRQTDPEERKSCAVELCHAILRSGQVFEDEDWAAWIASRNEAKFLANDRAIDEWRKRSRAMALRIATRFTEPPW